MATKTKPTAPKRTTNPEMGERGRARREELGLSKSDMCSLLQVSTQRVDWLERNGAETLSMIEKWAGVLGLDPADLAFGPGKTHTKRTKKASK